MRRASPLRACARIGTGLHSGSLLISVCPRFCLPSCAALFSTRATEQISERCFRQFLGRTETILVGAVRAFAARAMCTRSTVHGPRPNRPMPAVRGMQCAIVPSSVVVSGVSRCAERPCHFVREAFPRAVHARAGGEHFDTVCPTRMAAPVHPRMRARQHCGLLVSPNSIRVGLDGPRVSSAEAVCARTLRSACLLGGAVRAHAGSRFRVE